MPNPLTDGGYIAENEIWQRALEAPNGIEITFHSPDAAFSARKRLYGARSRQRAAHTRQYAPGDPMHGQSYWENLRVDQDGPRLRIRSGEAVLSGLIIREL